VLTGGSAATGAATVNTEDAWTEDVFAEMVSFPVAVEGMVIAVLKAPVEVVRKPNVVEPAMTVPEVETLNPVPLTVTADPAGPVAGLSVIWAAAAGAAWTGCTPASVIPALTARAAVSTFTNLNTAIGPRNRRGCQSGSRQSGASGTDPILRSCRSKSLKIRSSFLMSFLVRPAKPSARERTQWERLAAKGAAAGNTWSVARTP
jgi:hypothetical protein